MDVQLKVHGRIGEDGRLKIDVPTPLPAGEADIELTIRTGNGLSGRYDFSKLVGRLAWRGDAVAEQRGMRDEW